MKTFARKTDSNKDNWLAKVKGEAPVYLIDNDGLRHRIWDGPTLESIAKWEDVEELASWDELARFPPSIPLKSIVYGVKPWLVKVRGEKDIYLIDENGIRHRVSDPTWLNSLDQRTEVDVFTTWNELERFQPGKPISHANMNSADQSLISSSEASNDFISIRLQHLADNIHQDLALLKDYENELRYEDDPRRRAKYRREVEQLRESGARYKQEYDVLSTEWIGEQPTILDDIPAQLRHMDTKLDALLSGQVEIIHELNESRLIILARFNASEQAVITAVLDRLDQHQLTTVKSILDAVEGGRIAENEMQETLIALQESLVEIRERKTTGIDPVLSNAVERASEAVAAPTLDVKHKLKIAAPIIPMILSYEGEIELGSGLQLEAIWQRLVAKIRGK